MENNNIQTRMEALRQLDEEAQATRQALIQELTEKYERLAKQVKELDAERQDVGFKLACLRGEVDEPVKDFQSKRHHVKDEAILALLLSRGVCTTGDVQEYFAFSSATVCRRMDALLAAGKVTMEKRGTTKIWKAAA